MINGGADGLYAAVPVKFNDWTGGRGLMQGVTGGVNGHEG